MNRLELSIALTRNDFSRALLEGTVEAQGVSLVPSVLHASEMYWRQLRFADFDVSEMSLASLFIARSRGDQTWTALPVFTMRRFFHTHMLVRADAGIEAPIDLRGKRVGVPEYQQTAAVWCRGILEHEFGVHAKDIDWHMERNADKSHGAATGFVPPAGVRITQIPASSSIGAKLLDGTLDATLLYIRSDNLVDRSRADITANGAVRYLFKDREGEGGRYFRKTGMYPINHTVVVRTSLLEKHPWLALNLYTAFMEARNEALRACRATLQPLMDTGILNADAVAALKNDPAPYGIAGARVELESIATWLHEQGLTDGVVPLEIIFARASLDL